MSGVTGVNNTFTLANLVNSTATTRSANDVSTAVATTAFVHSVMPTGIIVMWNNTAASIPAGWQLCDGTNGTPDLRDKFIVGAGSTYAFGDTGGAASVTLTQATMPIHTHVLAGALTTGSAGGHTHTVTDPGHAHSYQQAPSSGQGVWYGGGLYSGYTAAAYLPTTATTTSAATGININSALDHTHSLTLSGNTQSAGGTSGTTQPHENRPPYYALCYIQKMN